MRLFEISSQASICSQILIRLGPAQHQNVKESFNDHSVFENMHSRSIFSILGLSATVFAHAIEKRAPLPVPQYLPIPQSAQGYKIPAAGYYVEPFGQGAYMVTDGEYQAVFLVSTEGVILVDAPPTIGRKLLYAIGNTTHLPLTHMVYSHLHADHIGAAFLVTEKYPNIPIIAQRQTKKLLEPVDDPTRPLPNVLFDKEYTVSVGNQTLELAYKGLNHVEGNIFIYASKQKVLMLVDIIFPGWIPFSSLGETKNVPGFIEAHDQALEYDFIHYVGGHIDRSGLRADVETQREYVHDLFENCEKAINLTATNDPNVGTQAILGPITAKNPGNAWAEFEYYLDVASQYCANLTNDKWLHRLAATDVFQVSNAATMIESLRIDYGVLGPFGAM